MEPTSSQRPTTIAEQLRLLEAKRAEVESLRRRGGGPDDGLANDLAGIRFVLRAALLSGEHLGGYHRDELERREREARELLVEVTSRLPS